MKITKTQLKKIIKEEVSDACGNLSEIKGHASPENLRKHFGPETLEKTGIKRSSDQDLEMQRGGGSDDRLRCWTVPAETRPPLRAVDAAEVYDWMSPWIRAILGCRYSPRARFGIQPLGAAEGWR